MHIHVIKHVPFEGPAAIEQWASNNSLSLTITRQYAGDILPTDHRYSLLVIMGGPMSVSQENAYPWLKDEKKFIEEAIISGKKILGICLGAQMIASVMGARVRKHIRKEIGWFPVYVVKESLGAQSLVELPEVIPVFHWHGEIFEIPKGCVHVARSAACENQCFTYEDRVVAMQFHLEMTPTGVKKIISECGGELTKDKYVQSAEEIEKLLHLCKETNTEIYKLLNRLCLS